MKPMIEQWKVKGLSFYKDFQKNWFQFRKNWHYVKYYYYNSPRHLRLTRKLNVFKK